MKTRKIYLFFIFSIFALLVFSFEEFILNKYLSSKNETTFVVKNILKEKNSFSKIEFGHTGRVWLNDESGYSHVYNGNGEMVMTKDEMGSQNPLRVKVDEKLSSEVFSEGHNFLGDAFIFSTQAGKVFGWHKNTDTNIEPLYATLRIDNSKSNSKYSGIEIVDIDEEKNSEYQKKYFIYLADNFNNKIDIYNQKYLKYSPKENFTDPDLPSGYSVYNLKLINNYIYIMYKKGDEGGIVNIFSKDGKFIKRLISGKDLANSWSLVKAPENFGNFSNMLLIPNSSLGIINAFDPNTGEFKGSLMDIFGNTIKIPNIRDIAFGTNNGAGESGELFFVTNKMGEDNLFGKIVLHAKSNFLENIFSKFKNPFSEKESLVENKKSIDLQSDFLNQSQTKPDYDTFIKSLSENCLEENCIHLKLQSKISETAILNSKIKNEVEVLLDEFKKNNIDNEKQNNLKLFSENINNLEFSKWQTLNIYECRIFAMNFYAKSEYDKQVDICMLYRLENYLHELYILRSIYITVEYGALGNLSKISKENLSDAFKKIADDEEKRIRKTY